MSTEREDRLTIYYLDIVSAAEMAPFIDAIDWYWSGTSPSDHKGIFEVAAIKRPTPSAAQGPFVDPAVVILSFISVAVATGFLERIGAEGWQAARAALYSL